MRGISIVVEGKTDVPVVKRVLSLAGHAYGRVHVMGGKHTLNRSLPAYNAAARRSFWLVLRDLDHDARCAPELRERLLPEPAPRMAFRIAVREMEAWLLGDRERLAEFLGVRLRTVPLDPECLDSPKDAVVSLAMASRRVALRDDIVPPLDSTARVGRGYAARVIEFAIYHWRPEVASERCDSLRRCLDALRHWR